MKIILQSRVCVTTCWHAWPPLFFPAMNTHMWEHPVTATHIATPQIWDYMEVPYIIRTLVCGERGLGAMA
ncbi:hypothetical protein Cfor_06112 [Coptotermes formosanus]|uniref:Uncharacterized protein n=1 Tax=Coptotermes formosanus TaxID=36987 RepID=A0A6L2Q023_COPFO|nr:hypothetical protein Cfor_06112 [Coptotermes formosanus]